MGDFRQIVPVVKGGSVDQIKMACIQNSKYWPYFEVRSLNTNMRLERLRQVLLQSLRSIDIKIASATDQGSLGLINTLREQKATMISDEVGQREYAKMILLSHAHIR